MISSSMTQARKPVDKLVQGVHSIPLELVCYLVRDQRVLLQHIESEELLFTDKGISKSAVVYPQFIYFLLQLRDLLFFS